jgi:hypothetical protein
LEGNVRPDRIYHYRGAIERGVGGSYVWREGYSENSDNGLPLYPWSTKQECQRAAKADGFRAVFYRGGKPEDTPSRKFSKRFHSYLSHKPEGRGL